jgi:hypothetical protein
MQGVERHNASYWRRGSAHCVGGQRVSIGRSEAHHALAGGIATVLVGDLPVTVMTDTVGFSAPPAEASCPLTRRGNRAGASRPSRCGFIRNSTKVEDLHTLSWVCQQTTLGGVPVKPGANATAAEQAAIGQGRKRWSIGRPLRRKPFHLSICMLGSAASGKASNPAANYHHGSGRCVAEYTLALMLRSKESGRMWAPAKGTAPGVGVLGRANDKGVTSVRRRTDK